MKLSKLGEKRLNAVRILIDYVQAEATVAQMQLDKDKYDTWYPSLAELENLREKIERGE